MKLGDINSKFAEERFSWVLDDLKYQYVRESDFEKLRPKLSKETKDAITKTPDFFVERPNRFIAEVKSFETPSAFKTMQNFFGTINIDEDMKPLRAQFKSAKKTLGDFRKLQIPMLVVLDDHKQLQDLSAERVSMLLGTWGIKVKGGDQISCHFFHGGRQSLTSDRGAYISAVAVNRPLHPRECIGFESEDKEVEWVLERKPMLLKIYHNPHAKIPLPKDWFPSPHEHNEMQM